MQSTDMAGKWQEIGRLTLAENEGQMFGSYYLTKDLRKDLNEPTKLYAQLNPDRRNDKSPDWLLYANRERAGVLWSRENERGEYFTGSLEVGSKTVRVMLFADLRYKNSWIINRDTSPDTYQRKKKD